MEPVHEAKRGRKRRNAKEMVALAAKAGDKIVMSVGIALPHVGMAASAIDEFKGMMEIILAKTPKAFKRFTNWINPFH